MGEKTVAEPILWERGLPGKHGQWAHWSDHRRASAGKERWRDPGRRRHADRKGCHGRHGGHGRHGLHGRHGWRLRGPQQHWLAESPYGIRLLGEDGTAGSTHVSDDQGDHGRGAHVSEPQCPLLSPPRGPPILKPNLQSERKRDRFSTLSTECHSRKKPQQATLYALQLCNCMGEAISFLRKQLKEVRPAGRPSAAHPDTAPTMGQALARLTALTLSSHLASDFPPPFPVLSSRGS